METDLNQSILKAICHLDVLSRPLTLLELQSYLDCSATASQVYTTLSREPLNQLIGKQNGLYFLLGHEANLQTRHTNYRLALKKLDLAKNYCRLLKYFPWVKGLAIYGSLGIKNSREQGDIDIFFVTAPDRVWSARFFINTVLKILRLRPTIRDTKNRICPSYLADSNHLDLSVANIEPDYYYRYYGPASFNFLYAESGIAESFFKQNSWVKNCLPNWESAQPSKMTNSTRPTSKNTIESLLGLVPEKIYQKIQLKILPQRYHHANDGKRVILETGIIKLHHNDRRIEANKKFDDNYINHSHD
jgi:hypothetical protein